MAPGMVWPGSEDERLLGEIVGGTIRLDRLVQSTLFTHFLM
eukprot:SAG22_NODE_10415_length_537_cov_0.561644_1_plen_40_part_01